MAGLETRHVRLLSPLPPDQLMLQRVRGFEELGRLFQFELELLSPDPDLKIDDLLGDKMTIVLTSHEEERFFNGIVTAFGHTGKSGRYERYLCTLRPFLWLMGHGSDCCIFPKMSVPDIVAKVVSDHGAGGLITRNLKRTYGEREYTVQYRESHLDFISRLLEEEGIYYYFDHTKDQHKLVLCDDKTSHENQGEIPFMDPSGGVAARRDFFRSWKQLKHVRPAAFAVNDFDFFSPSADLAEVRKSPLKHKHANFEHYEPFARFIQWGTDASATLPARQVAETRLEEAQADHERVRAIGNVRELKPGMKFDLIEPPRQDQGQEFLVVRAEYSMYQPGYDSGSSKSKDDEKAEELYSVEAIVQPSKLAFRPARLTPRPVISGPHTATVVTGGTSTDAQAREGELPVGPQEGEHVLGARLEPVGRQRLRRAARAARRAGGDRRVHRGRSRPADRDGPRLQRLERPALRLARRRDEERLPHALDARWLGFDGERTAARRQEGRRAVLHPRREEHGYRG